MMGGSLEALPGEADLVGDRGSPAGRDSSSEKLFLGEAKVDGHSHAHAPQHGSGAASDTDSDLVENGHLREAALGGKEDFKQQDAASDLFAGLSFN